MRLLRLSALTMALVGFSAGQAGESPDSTAATSADAAPQALWSSFDQDQSTLLPQARSVFAAVRARSQPEAGIEVVQLAANVSDVESDSGYCRHMGTPDSRIMSERCFNPSASEEAMNRFQFQAEMDENQRLHELNFLEHAQYSLEYRRSLREN